MSRCAYCARTATEETWEDEKGKWKVCCKACPQWHNGVHTAECNKATYPTLSFAEMLDDPNPFDTIMGRLQKLSVMSHLIREEAKILDEAGKHFLKDGWPKEMEVILSYTKLNAHELESAIRRLLNR